MTEPARITQQEGQPLPRWARLAFAARCVRRARPLLNHLSVATTDAVRVLDNALARVEHSTTTARPDDELPDAAAAAYTLALDNVDGKGPAPSAPEEMVVLCMVAHATAFAAEAATLTDARQAAHLVAQSVDFAIHAFRVALSREGGPAISAMRADLERLREAVTRERWGDASYVPASFFGPI